MLVAEPIDIKAAAALVAPIYAPVFGEQRGEGVDDVLGAVGIAFMRRLLRAAVLLYRRQQVGETVEETKHKILVPLHVYEAILQSPQLFDVLTFNGLGK